MSRRPGHPAAGPGSGPQSYPARLSPAGLLDSPAEESQELIAAARTLPPHFMFRFPRRPGRGPAMLTRFVPSSRTVYSSSCFQAAPRIFLQRPAPRPGALVFGAPRPGRPGAPANPGRGPRACRGAKGQAGRGGRLGLARTGGASGAAWRARARQEHGRAWAGRRAPRERDAGAGGWGAPAPAAAHGVPRERLRPGRRFDLRSAPRRVTAGSRASRRGSRRGSRRDAARRDPPRAGRRFERRTDRRDGVGVVDTGGGAGGRRPVPWAPRALCGSRTGGRAA